MRAGQRFVVVAGVIDGVDKHMFSFLMNRLRE